MLNRSFVTDIPSNTTAKPFLKWAGGKTQLIETINTFLPPAIKNGALTKYIEPFIGGGALFFHIAQNHSCFEEFYISDANIELIIAYETIKADVDALIEQLEKHEHKFHKMDAEEQKEYFYKIRKQFNSQRQKIISAEFSDKWIKRTAQLIFLNRTCFNGLFRVNSKGEFNVPIGSYKQPTICFKDNLLAINKILQKTTILHGDYSQVEPYVDSKTFVYFDPPYRPLNKTSSFNTYYHDNFDDTQQFRLAKFFRKLDKKRTFLMLSNSDPQNINSQDSFFEDMYKGFPINKVQANRMINSNSQRRGKISELLITNYL
jgi:DNA adenine methylase